MTIPSDDPKLDLILDSLANSKRRGIINYLAYKPATIKQLALDQDLSLPAIHKHILSLESADLIVRRKLGRTNFVALNHEALKLIQQWLNQYKTEWGSPNATLENYISRMNE